MAFTTHDNAPYLYRRSGGGGDKEIDKLVGGTIAWNQQGRYLNRRGTRPCFGAQNAQVSAESERSMTLINTGNTNYWWNPPTGHKILATFKLTQEGNSANQVQVNFGGNIKGCGVTLSANVTVNIAVIGQQKGIAGGSSYDEFYFYPNGSSGSYVAPYTIADFNIFDLTLMFGSTIADYVYSLEQSSQGSGLAWLRSYGFFTEDYYDYNSGELKSVSNLVSHDMTGEDASTTLHSYPLGDVTLRGLPKLNGNALYYDGDTYESNGTVTRKYGIVDLGSLNWNYDSPRGRFYSSSISGAKTPNYETTISAIYKASISPLQDRQNMTLAIYNGLAYVVNTSYTDAATFKTAMSGVYLVYELASSTTETADTYTNPQWVDPNGTERYTLSANAFPMPVGHETTYNTDVGSKTVNTQVNLSMTEPQVRQVYAKEGDTARVLNIHLDQTEEDGTLRILRPDGTEVTAEAVLVPEFYDGLMAEIPSDATEIVGKCYCDVEQNGVSSMPFTLNVKKNERAT